MIAQNETGNVVQIAGKRVMPGEERAVYTVAEVAQLLSLSLGVTYGLVRSGEIPARRLGSRWVIPRGRFMAWLEAATEPDDWPPHPDTSVTPRRSATGRR